MPPSILLEPRSRETECSKAALVWLLGLGIVNMHNLYDIMVRGFATAKLKELMQGQLLESRGYTGNTTM